MDLKLLTHLPYYAVHPESKAMVRFHDCDPNNHLNQSKYLDYFVDAREDQLRDTYGLDLYNFGRENGHVWMATKNQIAYLRQVSVHEVVTIQTHLIDFDQSNATVEMLMWDEQKTKPKSLLWASFAYVNIAQGKRASHQEEILEFFGKVKWDGIVGQSFDQRLGAVYAFGK